MAARKKPKRFGTTLHLGQMQLDTVLTSRLYYMLIKITALLLQYVSYLNVSDSVISFDKSAGKNNLEIS